MKKALLKDVKFIDFFVKQIQNLFPANHKHSWQVLILYLGGVKVNLLSEMLLNII